LGEFGGGLSRGSTGLNNGNNFAGNVTGRSYSRSIRSGGFSGGETMGFRTNKVQYNGQDDLLGEDFFDDKEATGN
jgi:heterogeneous nuclear ribonucleoprotein A1/A3